MLNWLLPMLAKAKELERATTIPVHGKAEIGSWLFKEILKQMGITEEEFNQFR
jgi:predicted RNA binding protein YcfA (HicA-like mRNA interferase family)